MKEFIEPGSNLLVEIIDWEDNYQGYVEFYSIELINSNYYCYYDNFHFERLDNNLPSLLDNETVDYVVCVDRTIRIAIRDFLGIEKYLIRAELGAQGSNLARFEVHDELATQCEVCHEDWMLNTVMPLFERMETKLAITN